MDLIEFKKRVMDIRAINPGTKSIIPLIEKLYNDISIPVEKRVSPKVADVDKGLGKCMEKNCSKFATTDYNGHKHYVCDYHDKKLNDEFDEEYK